MLKIFIIIKFGIAYDQKTIGFEVFSSDIKN